MPSPSLTPAGYEAKAIRRDIDWLPSHIKRVCSVSGCVSPRLVPSGGAWNINGFFLFNSPGQVDVAAQAAGVDLLGSSMLYYEVYALEFDRDDNEWHAIEPNPTFSTKVLPPVRSRLLGFDIITCLFATWPECSVLSCNGYARSLPINQDCLMDRFEDALEWINDGIFTTTEAGTLRIFSVSEVDR